MCSAILHADPNVRRYFRITNKYFVCLLSESQGVSQCLLEPCPAIKLQIVNLHIQGFCDSFAHPLLHFHVVFLSPFPVLSLPQTSSNFESFVILKNFQFIYYLPNTVSVHAVIVSFKSVRYALYSFTKLSMVERILIFKNILLYKQVPQCISSLKICTNKNRLFFIEFYN